MISRNVLAALVLVILTGCSEPTVVETPAVYSAEIRWTSYGIPHVKAEDWAGLGYGFAYATATDAVCVIARDLVMVNGERSMHFGSDDGNLASDVFHKSVLSADKIDQFNKNQSERAETFSRGYVAGFNRYLRDHEQTLPESCAGEPWVRPMDSEDVARLAIGVGIRYGLGRLQKEMAAAAPPVDEQSSNLSLTTNFEAPAGIGSNAVALGRDVTTSGRGILFGNPHYPWHGSSRFHLIHTTIPGVVDVMGTSLLTTTRVAIGFNRDIAWSHTVSTGLRSTLYRLELNPEDPMLYRYGNEFRQIEEVSVPITVIDSQGNRVSTRHQVYMTHYGPVVESDNLPWTAQFVFSVRDANLDNYQSSDTYDALNKARSIDDVEAAISMQGVAWTNTIAADRHGTAFYADISVVPNVDAELIARCRVEVDGIPARVVTLDGSDPGCEWKEDSRSTIPGVLPPQEMPRLRRNDYVSNSNDSYWLSNAEVPLEGYSPIIGNERSSRSLRTRAGLVFIEEALAVDGKISPDDMQQMIYSHRNFGAELLLDDVLKVCTADFSVVELEPGMVDVSETCEVLRQWDRRNDVDSRGGHIWREFWRKAASIHNLFVVPFDVSNPAGTPRGIAVDDEEVRSQVLSALASAQTTLEKANIPLDARLGDIQFAERSGEHIGIPGGDGRSGMWSVISAPLRPEVGYSPIRAGNSYIQVISWDEAGNLDPRAILTYSQSPEPESPHYADMTRLYSQGEWVRLPFSDAQINADPELVTLSLAE
ncbi:MAG: penicillin acylase family protein [Gammaproteobacteria bacterium]|nr:penicillin acylase family protein [Gammaproteobacteria bacterium]